MFYSSCAGVCSYEGRGGLCSIRLSVPLLKLRPRKDLVETLLVNRMNYHYHVMHSVKFCTRSESVLIFYGFKQVNLYSSFKMTVLILTAVSKISASDASFTRWCSL